MEPLLRPPEVARHLGISRAKAYQLIAAGDIASVRIGRVVRVAPADLSVYVARQRRGGGEAA